MNLDSFLQFVKDYGEVILAMVAIIISIVTWVITRRTDKRLEYQIINDSKIFNVDDNFKNEIEVFYNKEKVDTLRLLTLKFKNTGNKPIAKADYESPIRVDFLERKVATLFSHTVNGTNPPNLEINLAYDAGISENKEGTFDESVTIESCLLNPNDSFIINFLLGSNDVMFDVKGRIVGVTNIGEVEKIDRTFWDSRVGKILYPIWIFGLVMIGFAVYGLIVRFLIDYLNIHELLAAILGFVIIIFMIRGIQEKILGMK